MRIAKFTILGMILAFLSVRSTQASCTSPAGHLEICSCGYTGAVAYCTLSHQDPVLCNQAAQLQYDYCIQNEELTPASPRIKLGVLRAFGFHVDLTTNRSSVGGVSFGVRLDSVGP